MSTTSDDSTIMDYADESLDDLSDDEQSSKRQRNSLSDRCVICFSDTTNDLVTRPTTAGFQTLAKAANELKDHVYLTLKPFLDTPTENQSPVVWHRSCHRRYSHASDRHAKENVGKLSAHGSSVASSSKTVLDTITSDTDSGVATRATVNSYDKSICILCQQRKFKGDVKVIKCMTLECSKKLKDAAIFHNDAASLRILGCIDLIASDAVYHRACSRGYIDDHVRCKRRCESSSSSTHQPTNEDDSKQAMFYQELLSAVVGDSKVLDMNAVTTLYNRITEKSARNSQVRELLESDMSTAIEFEPPLRRNKSVLVYSIHIQRGSLVQRIIDFLYDDAPEQNSNTTFATHGLHEDHAIFYAATKVRAAILTTGKGLEIGDKVSDIEITNFAEQCVPPEVISLLRYIVDPIAADEVSDNYSSEMYRRQVVTLLGSCEVYQCINSRLVPLHAIYNQLGALKARALVAFHCLTGCDTTSHLSCRKSKKTLWAQLCKNQETLSGVASFGLTPVTPRVIPQWLVEFIVAAYGCHSNITDLTTARISLFKALTKKKVDADINRFLPLTAKALLPHMQRAALQTFISRQCCTSPVHIPDAINFGWR